MDGFVRLTRSDPAKSTNEILLVEVYYVSVLKTVASMVKTKCDRDEASFIFVDDVLL